LRGSASHFRQDATATHFLFEDQLLGREREHGRIPELTGTLRAPMMRLVRYQIRDERFGLCLEDAETPEAALRVFLLTRKGGCPPFTIYHGPHTALVLYHGAKYRAIEAPNAVKGIHWNHDGSLKAA
jgi:hypothetical protein